MKKIQFILIFSFFALEISHACTNFLITRGASADSSTMITYAADSHMLYGELYYWAARDNKAGDSLTVYEWDTGHPLGRIAQVPHTYKVVGNMNEHQLAIGETTYTGRRELQDTTGIIDYGSMIYLTLQRAKTAREAISVMTDLVAEYGYYSTGESISIADPKEVWIMEIIGKGPGNRGAVWVARRIPDGYISGHANHARITTFPMDDPENCLYAEDVIDFAREKAYFEGEDKDFSFSDAYAPIGFGDARFCEARVWSGFRKVNSDMEQYEAYAMGEDLHNRMPLWIKPEKKLSVQDVMGLMRDYFQGTKMDMTQDIGAGPNSCIVRWRPLTWEVDGKTYFNERAISTQQTGFSFVTQSRSWLPDPLGGILWFGVDDTYSTVYTPLFCGISEPPAAFKQGHGSMMTFEADAAFWIFNQVSNFAYTRFDLMIPFIQEKQAELEIAYVKQVAERDEELSQLYYKKRKKFYKELTAFSHELSAQTVSEWKNLYGFLFTRFMDGNVKTYVPGELNPKLEQPGYSESWYKQVIRETGDKFEYHEEEMH